MTHQEDAGSLLPDDQLRFALYAARRAVTAATAPSSTSWA